MKIMSNFGFGNSFMIIRMERFINKWKYILPYGKKVNHLKVIF